MYVFFNRHARTNDLHGEDSVDFSNLPISFDHAGVKMGGYKFDFDYELEDELYDQST